MVNGKIRSIIRTAGSTQANLYFEYGLAPWNGLWPRYTNSTGQAPWNGQRPRAADSTGAYTTTISGTDTTQLAQEQYLYGSSRLGATVRNIAVEALSVPIDTTRYTRHLGHKQYELTNHLGNVLTTISDQKKAIQDGTGTVAHWAADVVSYTDYYPFGMMMEERSGRKSDYRYGFMDAERDDELKGSGNSLNFNLRMYDPRLGCFLTPDPYESGYPSFSTYSFVGNSPIMNVEVDGGWWFSKPESNKYQVRGPYRDRYPFASDYAYTMSNVRAVSFKQNSIYSYLPYLGNILNYSAVLQKYEDPTMSVDAGDIASIFLGAYFKWSRKLINAKGAAQVALDISEFSIETLSQMAISPDLKESWVELEVMRYFANQESIGGNKIGHIYGDDEESYQTTFRFNQSFIVELEANYGLEYDMLEDKLIIDRETYVNSKVEFHLQDMFESKKGDIISKLE